MSVAGLLNQIKTAVNANLPGKLRVVGEISNLSDRNHWFFSLKDGEAVIRCVMFASAARAVSFKARDGVEVVATGRVDVYPAQGSVQLYVDKLEPVGQGALEQRLRDLINELKSEGYFDPEHKRPLPTMPTRIAVVTSRSAAALQDVINTASKRWAGKSPDKEPSFEQAIDKLEDLIEQIESGEVGLEGAIAQYEQGQALIKRCRGILDKAERRIAELTLDENGISLVTPPSRCPKCEHQLSMWRMENVPVLGWLWLRGKCRKCKAPISIQYPLVELLTAVLFGGSYMLFYMVDGWRLPMGTLGFGFDQNFPVFLTWLVMIACLVAATLIDAKLYIIPLSITWVIALVGLLALPTAAFLGKPDLTLLGQTLAYEPFFPIVGPTGAMVAWGGAAGLIIAISRKPMMGICLGMQLLFESSTEDARSPDEPVPGLGVLPGEVVRFQEDQGPEQPRLKVPHMGWNEIDFAPGTPLFSGLTPGDHVYFVHGYYCLPTDKRDIAATTGYGHNYCSADAERRAYWIGVFRRQWPSLVQHGIEEAADRGLDASEAYKHAGKYFNRYLDVVSQDPEAYGNLDVLSICWHREEALHAADITDPYRLLKQAENERALTLLPRLLEELDQAGPEQRNQLMIEGVFAGNIFDMGAEHTQKMFEEGTVEFASVRAKLKPRPWRYDAMDALSARLADKPYQAAILFVDNAGPDVVLGMIPLARHLLQQGTTVVLSANTEPSLNDVTHDEFIGLIDRVAKFDDTVRAALQDNQLRVIESGNWAPLIDLTRISPQLAAVCEELPIDLVVLEGMGRSMESNPDCALACDCLRLAMVKDLGVAESFGAELFDLVMRYHQEVKKVTCASNLRQIGIAIQAHRTDNKDRLPAARYMPAPFLSVDDDPGLPEAMKGYLPSEGGKTNAVWRCPDDEVVYDLCGTSYDFSSMFSGQQPKDIIFIRMGFVSEEEVIISRDFDNAAADIEGSDEPLEIPARHLRRNNLWLDGRVDVISTQG
eukprot:g14359.t1